MWEVKTVEAFGPFCSFDNPMTLLAKRVESVQYVQCKQVTWRSGHRKEPLKAPLRFAFFSKLAKGFNFPSCERAKALTSPKVACDAAAACDAEHL